MNELLNPNTSIKMPSCDTPKLLADDFVHFNSKVHKIRADLDNSHQASLHRGSRVTPTPVLQSFQEIALEDVTKMIMKSPTKSCSMDPLPTWLLKEKSVLETLVPYITQTINVSLCTGTVPLSFQSARITPILKGELQR